MPFLQAVYPDSSQVALVGMERASDRAIWAFARENGYVIVTKDADYYDLSLMLGAPPLVIWLQTGNADKSAVLKLLLDHAQAIQDGFASGLACVEVTG